MTASASEATAPIAVVLGTRPEIIKLAPVIRELGARAWVIHTGQHYDPNLADTFYTGAGLTQPGTVLDGVGGRTRTAQITAILSQLDALFTARRPAAVIVQGDTNSTNAGAQAASYHGIPLVHVEAGLRSHDRAMPEELNRQLVGVLADLHCAATEHNVANLRASGVPEKRIALTGNTIVRAVETILGDAGTQAGQDAAERFVLATIHRPENTDDPARLRTVLSELAAIELPVLLPLHPRTRTLLAHHGLEHLLEPLLVLDPLGHADFLTAAANATLLISDSGGVQEECTVLKKPLIVVRNSTERPESIDSGFAHLVPPGPQISTLAAELLADAGLGRRLRATASPYGDRHAAARIVAATVRLLGEGGAVFPPAQPRGPYTGAQLPAPREVPATPPVGRPAQLDLPAPVTGGSWT
ncbi:MAG TPA: UDP-N-acetylglucosamine 2-epimerase (non-hydrolyzing) [Candidatus Ruania gallistercoris]|uniref:UDP-N-acetylglucosamine 2-epimerase (Non-hydrolyzing) n=1 Tax=Candidatus Ruania gallistercoris TaxID=2838746 RepID=A0A9D2J387_9MICO|nr:UDP-N-acetylglucosamine 2-epimerase (non-hydrolyzing) [Candidatus Ruania gallistercoris]